MMVHRVNMGGPGEKDIQDRFYAMCACGVETDHVSRAAHAAAIWNRRQ